MIGNGAFGKFAYLISSLKMSLTILKLSRVRLRGIRPKQRHEGCSQAHIEGWQHSFSRVRGHDAAQGLSQRSAAR